MTFVIDNSVVVAWLLGEGSDAAEAVIERLKGGEAHVPALWPVELANVLVVAERRGKITEAQAIRAVEIALALPIRVVDVRPDRIVRELRALAREHRLSAYDAAYLHLALSEATPLATLDGRLRDAGMAAGLTVWPE